MYCNTLENLYYVAFSYHLHTVIFLGRLNKVLNQVFNFIQKKYHGRFTNILRKKNCRFIKKVYTFQNILSILSNKNLLYERKLHILCTRKGTCPNIITTYESFKSNQYLLVHQNIEYNEITQRAVL